MKSTKLVVSLVCVVVCLTARAMAAEIADTASSKVGEHKADPLARNADPWASSADPSARSTDILAHTEDPENSSEPWSSSADPSAHKMETPAQNRAPLALTAGPSLILIAAKDVRAAETAGNGASTPSAVPQNASSAAKDGNKDDSANRGDTVKSWTSQNPPSSMDKGFLNRLDWSDHKVGAYVLRTGKIYGQWVAAMQWLKNGRVVLTEYTPPMEYVTVVDPKTGQKLSSVKASDVNQDGNLEIAFIHEKLNDANYHMYTVYSLLKSGAPKLVWKSGGKFGDWTNQVSRPAGQMWSSHASHED